MYSTLAVMLIGLAVLAPRVVRLWKQTASLGHLALGGICCTPLLGIVTLAAVRLINPMGKTFDTDPLSTELVAQVSGFAVGIVSSAAAVIVAYLWRPSVMTRIKLDDTFGEVNR